MLQLAVVAVLCGTAAADAQDAGRDARLVEAQEAYEEATKLKNEGKYAEATSKAEHALGVRESILGGTHLKVAECLSLTGELYCRRGDCLRAEPFLQRALAIREAALGKSHPDVAATLNNLANLYSYQGLYGRAEPLLERARAIREAAFGESHPLVAASLNSLANLYRNQGLYSRAVPLYERALAIREAALGKSHPDVAALLNNFALLYSDQGLYNKAEPLYERALAIKEAALDKSHPDVASSLINLANLYADQGLYNKAEPLYERALIINETALGKSHPLVARSLNNLATIYADQGLYSKAKPLLERARAIYEAAFGKSHPDVAASLINLADLYFRQGLYGRAEPLLERARAIHEAALGKSHPLVADSLNNLAAFYAHQGLYGKAEPLYERALATREAALGKSHPDVAASFNDLARLRLGQRRLAEAVPLFGHALAISEGRLRHEALDFSESRLASFLQFLSKDEQLLYSLVRVHPDNLGVRRLALTSALLFKGRSVEEAADTSRIIFKSLGPQDQETFERLRGLHTRFAKLSLDGPGELDAAEYQQRLRALVDEGDALEADLARRSASLRALTELPTAADILERVVVAIPKDHVLVELVVYEYSPPVPKVGTPESKIPVQLRYLAMVIFPDGRTAAVDLGPADAIDKVASRLRDALAGRVADFQVPAQKLYQLVFKPLQSALGDSRKIFLAPDGELALVPFAALHDGRRFLVDAYDFAYLTSGRDLLARPGNIPTATPVVVFADPDYSGSLPARASAPDGGVPLAAVERSYSVERFFANKRAYLRGQGWLPLAGTRQEAQVIQRFFPQAQVFLGADASKERLLHLATPGILHIATHGFFLEDAAHPPGARALVASVGNIPRLPDPLLRSGLVLAGASSPADRGNSLVTALELAGLNLWGTDLVVLSACDTGLGGTSRGEVKRGQGVYGLRRSFIVAGAETLVVSLWKVDDQVTRTLMESYYGNLFASQGRVTALREAMFALRKEHPHPHYWAPFIGIGRDAPLRQFASNNR